MTGHTHKLCGKFLASVAFVGISVDTVLDKFNSVAQSIESSFDDTLFGSSAKSALQPYFTAEHIEAIVRSIVALMMLRIVAKAASVVPDYDQKAEGMPDKHNTTAKLINFLLTITGAHHRSRHTHSLDLTLIFSAVIVYFSIRCTGVNSVITLFAIGVASGLMSHIVADMFNNTGVWPTFWSRKKVAFVPKQVNSLLLGTLGLGLMIASGWVAFFIATDVMFGVCIIFCLMGGMLLVIAICCKGMKFNTGNQWEDIFYKAILFVDNIVTFIALLICFV